MIDLYLFNTIINTIWYLFTLLFVLYKFTSLFSYGYNFLRFCGKLFNSLYYVYDRITIYIKRRNGYEYVETQGDVESQNNSNPQPKTLLQSCKTYLSKQYDHIYYKVFGKRNNYDHPRDDRINLAEITIMNNTESFTLNKNKKDYENELFDQQMNELCLNSSSIELNYIQNQAYEDLNSHYKSNVYNHSNEYESIVYNHSNEYESDVYNHSNEYDPLIEPTIGNSELDAHLFYKSSKSSSSSNDKSSSSNDKSSSSSNDLVKNKNITRDVFHNVNLNNDSFLNNNYFNDNDNDNDNDTYSNKLQNGVSIHLEPVQLIIKDKLDTIPENSVNFKVYEYEKEHENEHEKEDEKEDEHDIVECTSVRECSVLETIFEESEPNENLYGNYGNHSNYQSYSYTQESDELRKEILKNPYI